MVTVFTLYVFFLALCFIFRKRLAVLFAEHGKRKAAQQELPLSLNQETVGCKVLVFYGNDYENVKDFENHMEIRLERCIAGLARQGHKAEVELHSCAGCVFIFLVKYA